MVNDFTPPRYNFNNIINQGLFFVCGTTILIFTYSIKKLHRIISPLANLKISSFWNNYLMFFQSDVELIYKRPLPLDP